MFHKADKNQSGEVDFEEFCTFYAQVYIDPEVRLDCPDRQPRMR